MSCLIDEKTERIHSHSPELATHHFGIEGTSVEDIKIRVLGPLPIWGADIRCTPSRRSSLEEAITATSKSLARPIAGYFFEDHDILHFHISRLARRIGEEVPAEISYRSTAAAILERMKESGAAVDIQFGMAGQKKERFVVGLREGYSSPGAATTHTLLEIEEHLQNRNSPELTRLLKAEIYSCRADGSLYTEPAALILNNAGQSILEPVVEIAYALKQARFSREDFLTDATYNIEILEYALQGSAQSNCATSSVLAPNALRQDRLFEIFLGEAPPSIALEQAYHSGQLSSYPELLRLRGIPQNPTWHAEGDVWVHTMMVVDEAWKLSRDPENMLNREERLMLLLGALTHDLGKAIVTRNVVSERGRGWTALKHENAGVEPTRLLLQRMDIKEPIINAVLGIVALHMDPVKLWREFDRGHMSEASFEKAVGRLIRKLDGLSWQVFLLACESDRRGRISKTPAPDEQWKTAFAKAAIRATERCKPQLESHLNGNDLIHEFSMAPGPELGRLLHRVNEEAKKGTIRSREEALQFVRDVHGFEQQEQTNPRT